MRSIIQDSHFSDEPAFEYEPNLPIRHDFNGYWKCSAAELDLVQTDRLTANDSDGTPDAANDKLLTTAPAYQTGPLGNYYQPASGPLYNGGSRTPGEAGMFHYATQVNQTKEGAEGGNVNIGLHYVATANSSSTTPKDTDGDGVYDYVENWHGDGDTGAGRTHTDYETDWNNPTTDTDPNTSVPIADAVNTKYDNIDLSGSGLTGWVKKALGLQPFNPINPLALIQVAGNDQNVISFEVPINYAAVQNAGVIGLNVDGHNIAVGKVSQALNGNTLFTWNSSYDTPGQHYLQVEIMSTAAAAVGGELMVEDDSDDAEVFRADTPPVQPNMGVIVPFYSANIVQLFRNNAMFNDNGASLNVLAAEPSATYTIDVYDPSTTPATLLAHSTGSAAGGVINENWPGTKLDGSQFTGNAVQVVYDVPPANPTTVTLNRLASSETSGAHDGFEFAYFYTPTKSTSMRSAYGAPNGNEGQLWRGMKRAVNGLFSPQTVSWGSPNYYLSGFNYYDFQGGNPHGNGSIWGYPGYLASAADLNVMVADMLNADVKNMYISGHGSSTYIGSGPVPPVLYKLSQQMADDTRNTDYYWGDSGAPGNPYRFVFLDGCETAMEDFWLKAFGILPLAPSAAGNNPALGPQAFVGWGGKSTDWTGEIRYRLFGTFAEKKSICIAWSYSQTLADFYELWQTDLYSLKECLDYASTADQRNQVPLSVGLRRKFTCKSTLGPYPYQSFELKNCWVSWPAPIYVIGHSGLTRNGIKPAHDGDPLYTRKW
jgi:hypothetical protein